MKKGNIVLQKSYQFAIRIVNLSRHLQTEEREYVLSKQLIRSGTAPGALIMESEHAQSKKDFVHKMSIALKEINETEYWLHLLRDTDYLTKEQFESMHKDCIEILKLLISIVKSSKVSA